MSPPVTLTGFFICDSVRLCQQENSDLILRYFELHLLHEVGYRPQLQQCINCHQPLEPVTNSFSPTAGGMLCPDCRFSQPLSRPLSVNALKVLRFLQTRDWDTCRLLRLGPGTQTEVERLNYRYITYHLERKVKSADFIERLRRQTEAN